MKKVWYVVVGLFLFVFGFFTSSLLTSKTNSPVSIARSKQIGLTSPLLDCELNTYLQEPQLHQAKTDIEAYLQENKNSYRETAVYFRDLNNGPWFGINERARYAPVSLLKVPVMIAYLKIAESNPLVLQDKLPYGGEHVLDENIPVSQQLTQGVSYSLNELIHRMIALSDNVAFEILVNHLNNEDLKTVHQELGLIYPDKLTPDDYITVKSYAGLFRILYNSTYLNREMSEKALSYLLDSDFDRGIRAGLPKNIRSALKFGIKDGLEEKEDSQIHDCGIVYVPEKPYLLCIMTKGQNREKLVEIIANISKTVYKNIALP